MGCCERGFWEALGWHYCVVYGSELALVKTMSSHRPSQISESWNVFLTLIYVTVPLCICNIDFDFLTKHIRIISLSVLYQC